MVRSVLERFEEKIGDPDNNGCWPWLAKQIQAGYGQLRVGDKLLLAHRVSWELYRGPIPEGMNVCHACDNPNCVNPEHLFIGTLAENIQDSVRKGRCAAIRRRGEKSVSAKLTNDDVLAIRASTDAHHVVAARFGISRGNVVHIRRYDSWWHI